MKTMRELLGEGNPPPADAATFEELSQETRDIAAALVSAPRDKLLHRIDTALDRNRAGDYRKRFANCLYDLRDLLVSGAVPAAEGGVYADWRIEAMDWDDGFFAKKPTAESWQLSPVELEEMSRAWQQKLTVTASRLSAEISKASPVLKPHWLVQAGAWQFKHARFDAAAQLFRQVIDDTPQHPRAEVARLMLARTQMEKWRTLFDTAKSKGERDTPEVFAARREADKALDAYLEAHPAGRFAHDIPGWRGGMARDAGEPANALAFFLVQVDFVDHPEIVRGAVRECEGCLDELDLTKIEEEVANNGGAALLPLDEIARRPLAALAVVYHFLDSESRRGFDELLGRVDSLSDRDITDRYLPPVLRMRRAGR